jgi:hypothetical protein
MTTETLIADNVRQALNLLDQDAKLESLESLTRHLDAGRALLTARAELTALGQPARGFIVWARKTTGRRDTTIRALIKLGKHASEIEEVAAEVGYLRCSSAEGWFRVISASSPANLRMDLRAACALKSARALRDFAARLAQAKRRPGKSLVDPVPGEEAVDARSQSGSRTRVDPLEEARASLARAMRGRFPEPIVLAFMVSPEATVESLTHLLRCAAARDVSAEALGA